MTDKIEVNQKATLGSQTTQIAVQNNHTGLSPVDAMQMALAIFRGYYPQLRKEALQDVEQMVTEKLSSIPAERIVSPSAKIVLPALINASITEKPELRKMYATLLANSMDIVVKNGIHPSFVEIINQLCPDEAKILPYINRKKNIPIITLRGEDEKGAGFEFAVNFSNIGELTNCEYPMEINKYFNNLVRLGLIEHASALASLTLDNMYEPLINHKYIKQLVHDIEHRKEYNNVNFIKSYFFITDFGRAFCETCASYNSIFVVIPAIKLEKGDS